MPGMAPHGHTNADVVGCACPEGHDGFFGGGGGAGADGGGSGSGSGGGGSSGSGSGGGRGGGSGSDCDRDRDDPNAFHECSEGFSRDYTGNKCVGNAAWQAKHDNKACDCKGGKCKYCCREDNGPDGVEGCSWEENVPISFVVDDACPYGFSRAYAGLHLLCSSFAPPLRPQHLFGILSESPLCRDQLRG